MAELGIPIVGQYSILGVLLSLVIYGVVAIVRGKLITERRQDQIDAEHKAEIEAERARSRAELAAAEERTKVWQELYKDSQSVVAQNTETGARLVTTVEAFEHFLKSFPKLPGDDPHGT